MRDRLVRRSPIAGPLTLVACFGGGEQGRPPFPAADVVWTDVTASAGLPDRSFQCLVFDDFDGDRRPDLLLGLAVPGASGEPVLGGFRNRGDGGFDAVAIPLSIDSPALSCEAGDVTGDGLLDVVVGGTGGAVTLLRGMGGLRFEDASGLLPPLGPEGRPVFGWATTGMFDLDRDGWLDLFLGQSANLVATSCSATADDFTCQSEPREWTPTVILHNLGGARFERMPSAPGHVSAQSINAVAVIDWDEDGFQDLVVAEDFADNGVYRNMAGTGAFEDIAAAEGVARYNHGMGVAIGDFDGDARRDLYVADVGPDQFYFGGEDGTLSDRAAETGVAAWTRYHSGWSPVAGDFNQDGYLDLFVVNAGLAFNDHELVRLATAGALPAGGTQADFVYVNQQDGRYNLEVVTHRPPALPSVAGGATALADYDGDGDLDIAEFYMAPPHFRLLRNDTVQSGHWLTVWLDGPASSVGAEASVRVAGDTLASRAVGATGSAGKSWRALHFGLGARTSVDSVRVRWPDGREQTVDGPIQADQVLVVENR